MMISLSSGDRDENKLPDIELFKSYTLDVLAYP